MCGILGGNKKNRDFKAGIECLKHRGPDGDKVIEYRDLVMAFARLAIIDLSDKAMQPMSSTEKNVHIVFNGEIYGYKGIRNALIDQYDFQTSSDTEVILALYTIYGERFIEKIDGMYAMAVYDEKKQKLFLYRDRVGIKPIYYYYRNGEIAFSSELKALERILKSEDLRVDMSAIYDYLTYGYIPDPKSMYLDIYKLPPATQLVFDLKKAKIERISSYWEPLINETIDRKRKRIEVEEELCYLLENVVHEQVIADVPVGTFLSGGIDSSIITYETKKASQEVEGYCMGFMDDLYSEIPYAQVAADHIGIKLHIGLLSNDVTNDLYPLLPKWYDEPFGDTSAFPTYLVSKNAANDVRVVLTGDGGDELFGGYPRYTTFISSMKNKRVGMKSRIGYYLWSREYIDDKLWEKEFMSDFDIYSILCDARPDFARSRRKREFGLPSDYDSYWFFRKYYNEDLPPLTRLRYLEFKTYLPCDILTKVDRAAMAVSLETRVPFLDQRIVEFAFSLSQSECNENNELKRLLKLAYRNKLSKETISRKKMGFSIPPQFLRSQISGGMDAWDRLYSELWYDKVKGIA